MTSTVVQRYRLFIGIQISWLLQTTENEPFFLMSAESRRSLNELACTPNVYCTSCWIFSIKENTTHRETVNGFHFRTETITTRSHCLQSPDFCPLPSLFSCMSWNFRTIWIPFQIFFVNFRRRVPQPTKSSLVCLLYFSRQLASFSSSISLPVRFRPWPKHFKFSVANCCFCSLRVCRSICMCPSLAADQLLASSALFFSQRGGEFASLPYHDRHRHHYFYHHHHHHHQQQHHPSLPAITNIHVNIEHHNLNTTVEGCTFPSDTNAFITVVTSEAKHTS